MANVNNPYGFKAVGHLAQIVPQGVGTYNATASTAAIFVNDIVKTAKGNAVTVASANDSNIGPVQGVQYVDAGGTPVYGKHWPGNITGATQIKVYVAHDPDLIMQVQCDGTFSNDNLQQNASLVAGTGDTTSGLSGMALDISTAASTASLPFRIISVAATEDNEVGDYTDVNVINNKHQYRSTTGQA